MAIRFQVALACADSGHEMKPQANIIIPVARKTKINLKGFLPEPILLVPIPEPGRGQFRKLLL
ncbi:hypothetical protein D3C85_1803370 [compost metagenome]